MRRLMGLALMGFMAACTTSQTGGMPCESCKFGVADMKAQPPKHFCRVDGKEIDCKTNPEACPGCKKK